MSAADFKPMRPAAALKAQGRSLHVTPLRAGLALLFILALITMMSSAGLPRDYLNHLARTHIEAEIWSDPDLQRHYALSFSIIPDLTMDLVVPWLAQLIGTWNAGAVTIWLALALPAGAGLVLARLFHGHVTWLSLGGFLAVFSVGIEWGFVNFVASSGLALLCFGLWTQLAPGLRRTLIFAPLGAFLALNHALAFLFFGFLALAWELASFAEAERGPAPRFMSRAALFDFPAMAPALGLIVAATGGASDLPRGTADFFSISQKLTALPATFSFFNLSIGVMVFVAVAAIAVLAMKRGYLTMSRKMSMVLLAVLALNVLMPTSVLGIWGLHLRFTAPLVILFFASVLLSPDVPVKLVRGGAAVLGGLIAISFVNGAFQMARFDRQAEEIRQVLAEMPSGAYLLSAYDDGPALDFAFAMHASAIAVIEKSAFVPGLFTNTSPVDVAPANIDLHMPQSLPLTSEALAEAAAASPRLSLNGYWARGFATAWPQRWDYILYFRGEAGQKLTGLPLCQTAEGPNAILYKVGSC